MDIEINDADVEPHKIINISLGKLSGRPKKGFSLRKSLMVSSVLMKARFVYMEEAHQYHNILYQNQAVYSGEEIIEHEPPRAPTPLPEVTVTAISPYSENEYKSHFDFSEEDNEIEYTEVSCQTQQNSDNLKNNIYDSSNDTFSFKKRLRVSDKETEAAISSILPKVKRLKANFCDCDLETDSCSCSQNLETHFEIITNNSNEVLNNNDETFKNNNDVLTNNNEEVNESETEDGKENLCNMEVDHLTSLVSIFSFNQQQSDLYSSHAQLADTSPPVLALTA